MARRLPKTSLVAVDFRDELAPLLKSPWTAKTYCYRTDVGGVRAFLSFEADLDGRHADVCNIDSGWTWTVLGSGRNGIVATVAEALAAINAALVDLNQADVARGDVVAAAEAPAEPVFVEGGLVSGWYAPDELADLELAAVTRDGGFAVAEPVSVNGAVEEARAACERFARLVATDDHAEMHGCDEPFLSEVEFVWFHLDGRGAEDQVAHIARKFDLRQRVVSGLMQTALFGACDLAAINAPIVAAAAKHKPVEA